MALSFKYQKYNYFFENGILKISFDFFIEPDLNFTHKIEFKNIKEKKDLDNFVFNIGLAILPSYYKCVCPPKIIIECGYLDKKQIKFWKKLYLNGLGEFFYQNKIDFTKKDFLTIESISDKKFKKDKIDSEDILIPIGGGKDSIVTLSLLKGDCFALNKTKEIKDTIQDKKFIDVKSIIDKKLLDLNNKGYYNGHTPFSAYLAFLTLLGAYLNDKKYIALSNERSSNEETTEYLGRKINHQYSKTFEFENDFRKYYKEYLIKEIEYFSFLRPLYEIQIAKLFSSLKNYHPIFLSCNEANKTKSGTVEKTLKWCGNCSKCLFVFTMLFPFLKEETFKIFNKNLFNDPNLKTITEELIGEKETKPFECIGERKESLIGFYLSAKYAKEKYFLLDYLEKNVFPKYKNLEKESKEILKAWNIKNNLPKNFETILKNEISKP